MKKNKPRNQFKNKNKKYIYIYRYNHSSSIKLGKRKPKKADFKQT